MIHSFGVRLLVIDYLGLIRADDRRASPYEKTSQISRDLKLMARELKVPVIALAQLSREVEKRLDKRPILSDLRDSGGIEQDADIVLFVYRPGYYGIKRDGGQPIPPNETEIIIAKHRNGRLGNINLTYDLETQLFIDATEAALIKETPH
jgi:replicative DNA helicase